MAIAKAEPSAVLVPVPISSNKTSESESARWKVFLLYSINEN